jgi:hypothetical protein
MVVSRKLMLVAGVVGASLSLVAGPVLGAYTPSKPNPIRTAQLIRVQDIAAVGKSAAIGWREGDAPGQLVVAISRDGGATYLKQNGKPRNFKVAGDGRRGLSLDICGGNVWVGSAAAFPGDTEGDSDVLISRKQVNGNRGQAFVTAPTQDRKVRQVDVACVGGRFLAVAWLENYGGRNRAQLLVRDQASLAPAAVSRTFRLGTARLDGGISVAATGETIHVAWSAGDPGDLRYKRYQVGPEADPVITKGPTVTLARRDAGLPELAVRGQKVALAFSDAGKLKVRLSGDLGETFGSADLLLGAGDLKTPSRATSVTISGERIVIEALKKQPRGASEPLAPVRIQADQGSGWSSLQLGNRGARVGALRKVNFETSFLVEAWHDNGEDVDRLRGQVEVP